MQKRANLVELEKSWGMSISFTKEKINFDTAENEPSEVLVMNDRCFLTISSFLEPSRLLQAADPGAS